MDPSYNITITVERGGEMVEEITFICLDYNRGWTDSPSGFARGFELEAPIMLSRERPTFRIQVPSAHLGRIEKSAS